MFCPNCGKELQGTPAFCPQCGKPLPAVGASGQVTAYCPHCGAEVDPRAEICPKCGVRIKQPPAAAEKKSLGLAAVLSAVFPGLGQFYNGQTAKGIAFLIVGVILLFFVFILYLLFWAYNIYDAYTVAKKINGGILKLG